MSTEEQKPKTFDLTRGQAYNLTASGEQVLKSNSITLQQQKEFTARRIGLLITATFMATTGTVLVGAILVLTLRSAEAKYLLLEVMAPFLEKLGAFLSATFSPLLAFVLGYYFGKSKDGSGTD